jgi:hypothetical protein
MSPDAPSLHAVQAAMRRALVAGDTDLLDLVVGGADAAEGVSVYRSGLLIGVAAALALTYPAVAGLVGRDFFDAAARRHVSADPPRSGNLDEYGADFADFLAGFAPAADLPYLADVARLEWAVAAAMRAEDAPSLTPEDLTALAESGAEDLRLGLRPSARVIAVAFPADLIWRGVLDGDGDGLAALDLGAGGGLLLVDRADDRPVVERLDGIAGRFAADLAAGHPLAETLEAAGGVGPALLGGHLVAGRLIAVQGRPILTPG